VETSTKPLTCWGAIEGVPPYAVLSCGFKPAAIAVVTRDGVAGDWFDRGTATLLIVAAAGDVSGLADDKLLRGALASLPEGAPTRIVIAFEAKSEARHWRQRNPLGLRWYGT
jgi:hypothetical protein